MPVVRGAEILDDQTASKMRKSLHLIYIGSEATVVFQGISWENGCLTMN